MNEIRLDFSDGMTPERLHEIIREKLCLPDFYGKNLDALYDVLTCCREETVFYLHTAGLAWALRLKAVLEDASAENDRIRVVEE